MRKELKRCNYLGNISSLHYYHRYRVKEADRLSFGKLVGVGNIIIGATVIILGAFLLASELLNNISLVYIGIGIMTVGFVVGLGISFYAMKKYNHGIF